MKRLDIADLDSSVTEIDYTSTSATVDTWTYKNSAGQTLKTITITYTDSTKAQISSVVRS